MLTTPRFKVRRRSVVVGGNGRGTNQDTIHLAGGIVAPAGSNGQQRKDDGAFGISSYQVITCFQLRKQAEGIYPDVVLYAGLELLVIDVSDYSRFGKGWVEALCTSKQIPEPPVGSNTP